ncbi:MAG: HAMP domain-containing protein [Nitrospirae bacterium]|nr:HAMP domain-containing protein [Nitrospirota bacterium]
MLRSLSIRTRLLIGTVGIVMLLGAATIFFATTVLHERLLVKLQKRGVSIARHLAASGINPILTEKDFELEMILRDVRSAEEDIEYIFIMNPKDEVLAHTFGTGFPVGLRGINRAASGSEHSTKRLITEKGEILDIAIPLMKGQLGVLHLGMSGKTVEKDLNDVILSIVWIIVGVSVAGIGTAVALDMMITRPILELAEAARAVGGGDLDRKISVTCEDEIGQLGMTFNSMIEKRKKAEEDQERLILQLQESIAKIKTLSGLLPICSSCKKIRDDKGYWNHLESYISSKSYAEFSHGICPDCLKQLYPDFRKE